MYFNQKDVIKRITPVRLTASIKTLSHITLHCLWDATKVIRKLYVFWRFVLSIVL